MQLSGNNVPTEHSADVLELCRLFLLDTYLKHFGKNQAFKLLASEHQSTRLNLKGSILVLMSVFALTWVLQSRASQWLVNGLVQWWRYVVAPMMRDRGQRPEPGQIYARL